MYLRIVLRSQPVNLLMAWMLIPCRCSSFSSCTSLPLNKSRNLLRMEWSPVYHVRGGGNFNGDYGDYSTAADMCPLGNAHNTFMGKLASQKHVRAQTSPQSR